MYRLTKLEVDNFKALDDFSMDIDPLTVIIGDNASGKSSVLQVLAFLKSACTATVSEYLSNRRLAVEDLVSNLFPTPKKIMKFALNFADEKELVRWEISFFTEKSKGKIELRSEKVQVAGKIFLLYDSAEAYRFSEKHSDREAIAQGVYTSSQISFIDLKRGAEAYPHLCQIKQFFLATEPLDLLMPRDMRRSARGDARTLGQSGERLPALIQQLTPEENRQLQFNMQQMIPQIAAVKAVVHGRPGWAHIETEEQFVKKQVTISFTGLSDGTLRLMALFSLGFLKKSGGITLLDEVEDGIHSGNVHSFFVFLKQYYHDNQQQVMLTTHSTVFLDEVPPAAIRYLYRDEKGFVLCKKFLELQDVQQQLEYLYPGEVILNMDKKQVAASFRTADHD